MILLNEFFSEEIFFKLDSKEEIKNSPNNSTLVFDYKDELLETFKFCFENGIPYSVHISSIKEFIFILNFNAKYAFVEKKIAQEIQIVANEYLSDTKIIVTIENSNEISEIAQKGIDGVFF
jgi:hypothetical protein